MKGLNLTAWEEWEAWRKQIKKPYKTDRMKKKMATYPQEIQAKAIQESLDNEWQGLFPDKFLKPQQKMQSLVEVQSTTYRPITEKRSEDWTDQIRLLREARR